MAIVKADTALGRERLLGEAGEIPRAVSRLARLAKGAPARSRGLCIALDCHPAVRELMTATDIEALRAAAESAAGEERGARAVPVTLQVAIASQLVADFSVSSHWLAGSTLLPNAQGDTIVDEAGYVTDAVADESGSQRFRLVVREQVEGEHEVQFTADFSARTVRVGRRKARVDAAPSADRSEGLLELVQPCDNAMAINAPIRNAAVSGQAFELLWMPSGGVPAWQLTNCGRGVLDIDGQQVRPQQDAVITKGSCITARGPRIVTSFLIEEC